MVQKTSINIKPCNIGSSEPHNRRTAEYLTRINKEKFYIRTDLMPKNEAWVAPDFRNTSLTERYNQIAVMVKEKTGRAMQTKDRERVNKKTGKVTIVRGSTPLKEGVVVIKEDTTMEQLKHFARCARNAGVSHPCKCSSTVTRGITAIPKTLPLGSPIFTHISSGTG